MAGRCLIVANQTLGGEALDDAVKERISRDVRLFYVVVPTTRVEHEVTDWTGGFDLTLEEMPPGVLQEENAHRQEESARRQEESARRFEHELAEARGRAQRRLDQMIEKLQSMGGEAEGEVGGDDPFDVTSAVLEQQSPFDEIIVSTLPSGLSRWVKMDLSTRIARMTDVPVTTIEAFSRVK